MFNNTVGRPRATSDDELLDAAERALVGHGPAGFTLRTAAGEAGVSAATYVKRFGSRQELLVALSRRWIDRLPGEVRAAVAGRPPGAEQVRAATVRGFERFDDPDAAAAHLMALTGDLADPELRRLLAQGWRLVKDGIARAVSEAHAHGRLCASPEPAVAARVLHALAHGAFLDWSVDPSGRLADRLAADLTPLVAAWSTKERTVD